MMFPSATEVRSHICFRHALPSILHNQSTLASHPSACWPHSSLSSHLNKSPPRPIILPSGLRSRVSNPQAPFLFTFAYPSCHLLPNAFALANGLSECLLPSSSAALQVTVLPKPVRLLGQLTRIPASNVPSCTPLPSLRAVSRE
jgi:hypothetical protein